MIDLHIHTTASDGQYAPQKIIEKAKMLDLSMVSITDHDTIDGILEGAVAAKELGIAFVPGIEISVEHNEEMHILGYGVDIKSSTMKKACSLFVDLRKKRAMNIIQYLREFGFDITIEEVTAVAEGDVIGRPHFARLLLEKGYTSYYREAFEKYLAVPEFDNIERPRPSAKDGIKIITDAGGVAVLAHPMTLKLSGDLLDKQVSVLKSYGLYGIETYYSKHSSEQISEYHRLAEKYALFETCGSDYHGENIKSDIFIGMSAGKKAPLAEEETEQKIFEVMKQFKLG